MHTHTDKAELDLVAAVLLVVPEATTITLELAEFTEVPTWDTMAVLTVGMYGALDALELDADVIAAFSAAHPPTGRYVIDIDAALTAPLAPPIPLPLPAPTVEPIECPRAAS
ncbi:hypothetical protein HCA61_22285 [Rhodococcus sp. HNM0563]|uniref:hypothetical protein n=1 Tax=Rhodococcus sp. HNM0563 TaxID=2716339 RepID=UPI00146F85D3|nr:hypothetical protein [Rhodococcus sp. HNM0563]NLU64969.1 hypothetical protein [Rhodococcus sp. HNM0563]